MIIIINLTTVIAQRLFFINKCDWFTKNSLTPIVIDSFGAGVHREICQTHAWYQNPVDIFVNGSWGQKLGYEMKCLSFITLKWFSSRPWFTTSFLEIAFHIASLKMTALNIIKKCNVWTQLPERCRPTSRPDAWAGGFASRECDASVTRVVIRNRNDYDK